MMGTCGGGGVQVFMAVCCMTGRAFLLYNLLSLYNFSFFSYIKKYRTENPGRLKDPCKHKHASPMMSKTNGSRSRWPVDKM